jgi:hypothetical protein
LVGLETKDIYSLDAKGVTAKENIHGAKQRLLNSRSEEMERAARGRIGQRIANMRKQAFQQRCLLGQWIRSGAVPASAADGVCTNTANATINACEKPQKNNDTAWHFCGRREAEIIQGCKYRQTIDTHASFSLYKPCRDDSNGRMAWRGVRLVKTRSDACSLDTLDASQLPAQSET